MKIHLACWCDGSRSQRSRKGSLADKTVKLAKRKAEEDSRPHVTIEGEQIDNVHSFVYLGGKAQCDGDNMADVQHRMNIAQAAFSSLSKLWNDHRLPLSMKIRMYSTAVCSTLTHACESWDLTPDVAKSIIGFNSRCLHIITGKNYSETATNPDLNLLLKIRKRRLRYLGHVLRMEDQRLVKRTLLAYVYPTPPPGSLLDDCNGKSVDTLIELAADRKRWSSLVNNLF